MTDQPFSKPEGRSYTIVLVNILDNPVAGIDESTFKGRWRWIKAPADWSPGHPLPEKQEAIDAVIVFSRKYQEQDVRKLCEAMRGLPELADIPLLVAVDKYEIPLANRVREMPNTDYIVTPIEEKALIANLNRAAASKE